MRIIIIIIIIITTTTTTTTTTITTKEEKTRKLKLASPCGQVMIHHTGTKIPQNENEKGKDKQQHS